MKKKPVLIGVVFLLVVLGVLVYSSLNLAQHRVEVCMAFNGQTTCRTAAGQTKDNALETAISNACADIASGVTDSIACERTEPTKETWLQ
jgi:hypothetical protein